MKIKFIEKHQTSLNGIDIVFFEKDEVAELVNAQRYLDRGIAVAFEPEEFKVQTVAENKPKRGKK